MGDKLDFDLEVKDMSTQMSEKELYEAARRRVEEKKGFFVHLAVYILVNIMLVIIWAFPAGGGYPWFIWPLGGWGIGLLFHFLGVFVFSRKTDWDRREIEKEVERLKREQNQ
jgi:hypothetical protein